MRIIVTGGAGFLGSALAQVLSADHEVFSTDRVGENVNFTGDLRSLEMLNALTSLNADAVVHLAGTQYTRQIKPSQRTNYFGENVEMARQIVRLAEFQPSIQKVIFVSTDMVYGIPTSTPVNEASPPNPLGPYGQSKLDAESILTAGAAAGQFDLVIFRPRLIAGEGRRGTIAELQKLIERGLPVPVFGSGLNHYQMVHKDDVCSAIKRSLREGVSGIFNLGSDDSPTVKQLLNSAIRSQSSRSFLIHMPNRLATLILRTLDDIGLSPLSVEQFSIAGLEYVLDTKKAKTVLGWSPTIGDEEILRQSTATRIQRDAS